MGDRCKISTSDFTNYLQSVVKLDALEKMTQDLDRELADSQKVMLEIKAMYDSVSTVPMERPEPAGNALRHEDISKFLDAEVPQFLMPDMVEGSMDIDIDDVIASMKSYAEELKKNFTAAEPQAPAPKAMESIDIQHYAQSLDNLSKRLANMKLNKDELNNRNTELEDKLTTLCEDVNMFTKMVQAKTTLSECNKNWVESRQDSNALQYNNIINKLLSGINEVTYLLQNKN